MSINPVQGMSPTDLGMVSEAKPRPGPRSSAPSTGVPVQPEPGTTPKQKPRMAESAPAAYELPQDEVQVQRDGETNGKIVVRYMDHHGNLILQVPSTELLGLARAINEDFQQEEKSRASSNQAQVSSAGGKTHD